MSFIDLIIDDFSNLDSYLNIIKEVVWSHEAYTQKSCVFSKRKAYLAVLAVDELKLQGLEILITEEDKKYVDYVDQKVRACL
ncbi:MAG: hypothetical protein KatS3mg001_535 [Candidatus Pacearchaeota archaeon]|nr:MAG: hypothetical protein KatS3mg001_535 [Candidatus Pacearchaeota archaeon]